MAITDQVLEESMRLVGISEADLRAAYPEQTDLLLSTWMFQFGYQPEDVQEPTRDHLLNCFLLYFNFDTPDVRIYDTYDALCGCFYEYLGFVPADIPPGTIDRILWMLRQSHDIPTSKPIRCRVNQSGHLIFYADTDIVPDFNAYLDGDNVKIDTNQPPISNVHKDGDHLKYDYTD